MYVPGAFTPNDDGTNDSWYVDGWGIARLSYLIFDQWGRKVYTGLDKEEHWDGRNMNGNPVQEGVYTVKVEGTFRGNRPFLRKGTITLIR